MAGSSLVYSPLINITLASSESVGDIQTDDVLVDSGNPMSGKSLSSGPLCGNFVGYGPLGDTFLADNEDWEWVTLDDAYGLSRHHDSFSLVCDSHLGAYSTQLDSLGGKHLSSIPTSILFPN